LISLLFEAFIVARYRFGAASTLRHSTFAFTMESNDLDARSAAFFLSFLFFVTFADASMSTLFYDHLADCATVIRGDTFSWFVTQNIACVSTAFYYLVTEARTSDRGA
jgi:hypothetical protein